jgi:hypothetical protein
MSPADTHLPGRPISGIEIIVLEIFTEYLEISRQVKTSLSAHIAERNLFSGFSFTARALASCSSLQL